MTPASWVGYLSHHHLVAYYTHYQKLPPLPYPIAQLGHAHLVPLPNADLVTGLEEALKGYRP